MTRQVYIHAGAHRTGTSSFQLCLAANKPMLEKEGFDLAYPSRDGAPGGTLHLRLPKPRHNAEEVRAFYGKVKRNLGRQMSGPDRPLILSEENLPGLIINFFSGRLYPNRKTRLQLVSDALREADSKVTHVLLVVRPYDALFSSGFRKHAEDNAVKPFSEHAEAMSRFSGGWPQTAVALKNAFGPDRLSVVEYGARGESRALLGQLLGREASDFAEPERDLNTSATDAALEHLQAKYHAGQKLARPDWQAVIKEFASQTEDRGFTRFSEDQLERLTARYDADLEELAKMEGVNLITK